MPQLGGRASPYPHHPPPPCRWINDDQPAERAAAKAARNAFATPLDEIDAAARILDPIFAPLAAAAAAGSRVVRAPYGAFLKDYHATEW